jgi:N-acetylglucosaminyldiphosphoundecaprenol N-acetyl-beta-D-mannosaminyltransferase
LAQTDPRAFDDESHNQSPAAFTSCSVRIDAITVDAAARRLLKGDARGPVHLCNAYTLALASRDPSLAAVLNRGSLNLPDGKPLIWIARSLGLSHMTRRVYGPELMERTLDEGQATGARHYLYGSTPEVIEALVEQVHRRWPDAVLVGAESPPFGELSDVELNEAVSRFQDSGAEIVWVGLGTPRQDIVVERLGQKVALTFVAIGAAFDFIAETKRQAPRVFREHGLEWLFRLVTEPRRLWKRYLVGNTIFLFENVRRHPRRRSATVDE